jgi:hypothetical protein
MSAQLAQLELIKKACAVAIGSSVSMSVLHWTACVELLEAECPLAFVDVCLAGGYDLNALVMRPVLQDLVRDGLATKVRKPPSEKDPKGAGYRYMPTSQLRSAARFLAADFRPTS